MATGALRRQRCRDEQKKKKKKKVHTLTERESQSIHVVHFSQSLVEVM